MDHQEKQGFRSALGRFATGVTIVTTNDRDGQPIGVTANSFNSVSLDPPMVLWSLAKSSYSLESFSTGEHFAVHILSCDQQELSNRFARRGENKFEGLTHIKKPAPLLEDCTARFICRTAFQYEGGDHIIFVGEVTDYTAGDKPPLLYLEGRYAEARRPADKTVDQIDPDKVRIGSQSLTHLLARAYVQISRQIHRDLVTCDMKQPRLMIMIAIEQHESPHWEDVRARVEANGYSATDEDLEGMISKGWIAKASDTLRLTTKGREHYHEALSRMSDFEATFCEGLTEGELAEIRYVLGHIIDNTDDGEPTLI